MGIRKILSHVLMHFISLFLLLIAKPSMAINDTFEDLVTPFLEINPGLSIASPTLRIKRLSDDYKGDITGTPGILTFNLDIKFRDFNFPDSNFGFTTFIQSGFFSADEQFDSTPNIDNSLRDVGTSVSGFYSYVVPALYYKQSVPDKNGVTYMLGGGIGYGAVSFDGDIILGPDRTIPSGATSTKIDADVVDAFSFVLFYHLDFRNVWRLRVAISETLFDDEQYDYTFDVFNISLSRRFEFF